MDTTTQLALKLRILDLIQQCSVVTLIYRKHISAMRTFQFFHIRINFALQNYYKYLEYTRILAKKYRLCSHKQYFSVKGLLFAQKCGRKFGGTLL